MQKIFVLLISCVILYKSSYSQKKEKKEETIIQNKDTAIDDSDESVLFSKVDVRAQFPGGVVGWRRFLAQNLNSNVPIINGAPVGTYKVMVRFVVAKDGTISNIYAETKHGYGMEDEVKRVLTKSPKWIPAMQNNLKVMSFNILLSIRFAA
jgi:hypothetical protein